MNRSKIATQSIDFLESKLNCENVIKFVNENFDSSLGEGLESAVNKIMVSPDKSSSTIPMAYKVMKYNDTEDYVKKEKNDPNDKTWTKDLFNTFDFMTEANYTGFEYFPYLYGVLDCHDNENSKIYIFYEVFDGDLINLINNLEHPSDWYDIAFQMIMINYYIQVINGYRYNDGNPQNHLYKKLVKPYNKEYKFGDNAFRVNHKYLITLWDINYIEKITETNKNQIVSNIDFLLKYLDKNKPDIKVYPTGRIIKLLYDIKNSPEKTTEILYRYYGPTRDSTSKQTISTSDSEKSDVTS